MNRTRIFTATLTGAMVVLSLTAQAMIDGVNGPSFALTAKSDFISSPEGGRIFIWGYANGGGPAQYPGPTMIVNQGETVTVTLTNTLSVPVSIVFPGQTGVTATEVAAPTAPGLLALEASSSAGTAPGGTVQYSFVASEPGTYSYHSGTQPDLQIAMGMVGALVVRPTGVMPMKAGEKAPMYAYNHPDTMYDDEFLFLLTEMDPRINDLVEHGKLADVDLNAFFPVLWFINGRCAPDTMEPAFVPWLPTQPYNSMPMMHPGDKLLLRVIGGGRDSHPFHHHGNNSWIIARDGRMLASGPDTGPDLKVSVYTIQTPPGGTVDATFEWTGEKLGWDIYGHEQDIDNAPTGNFPGAEDVDHNGNGTLDSVPLEPHEYAPDHGKPFPTQMPEKQDLAPGGMWNGSPFLGSAGILPPGEGRYNVGGGYYHMWHSHTEKEMVNNDIFPGGMMTMLLILPPNVPFSMAKTAPKN